MKIVFKIYWYLCSLPYLCGSVANRGTVFFRFFSSVMNLYFLLTNKLAYFSKILVFSRQNKTDYCFCRDQNCIYSIYVATLPHFRWD